MRTLYLDCFAGISGDMTVGALLDLGVDFEELKGQLVTLGLRGYEIGVDRVKRSGLAAAKFNVAVEEGEQPHRHLSHIVALITHSQLSETVKARSLNVFEKLAEAEAKIHGSTVERVHFHEVGAVDSILDIVGAVIGFEMLGVEKIIASPLRVGYGSIKVAHGLLPVPAPATAELLRGLPMYAGDIEGEFVTPTGAAIVAALAQSFGTMPAMTIDRIGYGAGTRDPKGFPNTLRAVLGETLKEPASGPDSDLASGKLSAGFTDDRRGAIYVIETNIDDMNPQVYSQVLDRAFGLGALDAFLMPVQMKKHRPGVLVTLLCEAEKLDALCELLLTETTTLGVRYYEANRRLLERRIDSVQTKYGTVRVKAAYEGEHALHFQPEYEDCAKLAEAGGLPLIEVQAAAIAAYRKKLGKDE